MRADLSGWAASLRLRVCRVALLAGILAAPSPGAWAQFPPPPPPPGSPPPAAPPPIQQRWPDPQPPRTTQQQQQPQQPARAQPEPPASAATRPATAAKARPRPSRAAPALTLTCSGVFAKDTSHRKLARRYDSRNIVFTDIPGPDNTQLKASVLFPRDPQRRLEVLWRDETARTDVQVIAINGKSHWTAPKGLKLGLPLASLERINGRPFKLSGIGADGSISVLDWAGGALERLPGGCKVGVRLAVDRAVPSSARAALAGAELTSNAAALKAAKPTIIEILIGY